MTKIRVTISIDENIVKKLRKLQGELMLQTNKNWSFSTVLGLLCDEILKTMNSKKIKELSKN